MTYSSNNVKVEVSRRIAKTKRGGGGGEGQKVFFSSTKECLDSLAGRTSISRSAPFFTFFGQEKS